jgi:hypothetical protein
MEQQSSSRGHWAFGLTVLAFGWGLALTAAAFVLPVYSSSASSAPSGGSVASASSTLVQVNGLGVLAPVGLPALIAAVIWFALHRKCSRGSRVAGHAAWALIWLLVAFCLAAFASIGMFVVPTAALLAGAAALTPSRAQSARASTA